MFDVVTFDYWNTLVHEGPEALVRARLPALVGALADAGHSVPPEDVVAAHSIAFDAYQAAWLANQQFCVHDAVDTMLQSLRITGQPRVRDSMITAFADAGHRADLRLAPGVAQCLEVLRAMGTRLAIVCDVGLTPTPVLLARLERDDLLAYFDAHAFSEEVGWYKPHPKMFVHVLSQLGAEPSQAVHVGDRLRTDVGGARALGMASIRYRGIYDDPDQLPEADFVVDDLAAIPPLLARMTAFRRA